MSVIGEYAASAARPNGFLAALQQAHEPFDSVTVKSPLPGGVRQVVRFLLTTVPSWVQIAGVLFGTIVGITIVVFLFRHRRTIIDWIAARSTAVKLTLAAVAVAVVATAAAAGTVTWNYTQHSNDFCTGCHVMDRAVDRMRNGTTKHAKLSCHSCHQQPLSASISQLYVWVSERPERIEKHANVPNHVCETCHVTQDTARWQRIAATAGHRVHLESDSSALKDIKCVTCHGRELHRFEPAKATCGQEGCHDQSKTKIVLGKMAGQTVRHCTSCHQFTADVPALATTDSARGTLVPGASQCLGCHQMRKRLAEFDVRRDPHGGKCGMCHDPHKQERPEDAARTCTNAGCHDTWKQEPFHVNSAHKRVGSQCLACHLPHSAKVDASDCQRCHSAVRQRGRLKPPLPFDTAQALKRSDASATPRRVASSSWLSSVIHLAYASFDKRDTQSTVAAVKAALGAPPPPAFEFGVSPPPPRAAAPDSFPHSRHERFACLVCHETRAGRGRLTFERPRGCQICHHQAPARSRCESCHQKSEFGAARLATATVTVPGHSPKPRTVEFQHSSHLSKVCTDCHTTPVTLAPSSAKAECRDCHADHHAGGRTCATCHAPVKPKASHTMEAAHQRCAACHTPATIASLTPTRTFCATCHTSKGEKHYPQKECTECHFLTDPATYRARITTGDSE